MYNAGLHEILTTRLWDMHPIVLQAYSGQVMHNVYGRIPFVIEHENLLRSSMVCSNTNYKEQVYAGEAAYADNLKSDDKLINIIGINGPVTRGGGACSYGSKEIRDLVMQAADMSQTIGHIFCIDTPGGSAQSTCDFEQAIDYLHGRGQKAIAFVDGMACSAGYALAAMCDEIYVMHPNHQVGCIGTMCAFYAQRHGDENENTHERYIELYAEGSPYKNREFREASEGNYDSLMADLNRSAEDFKVMVRKNRPNISDEQLLGDTYDAADVVGSMIDGIGDLGYCIERMLEITGEQSMEPVEEPVETPSADDVDEQGETYVVNENEMTEIENNNQIQKEMKDYLNIQAALGENALCSDREDALFLNAEQCEVLEQHLGECEQKANALDAKMTEIASLNAMIETLKAEHAEAINKLNEEHASAIETLNAEHATAVEELGKAHDSAIETLKAEHIEAINALNVQLEDVNKELTQAKEDISAKEAEIVALSEQTVEAPKPVEAPIDNNVVAEKEHDGRVCKENMTAKERREALAKQWGKPNY